MSKTATVRIHDGSKVTWNKTPEKGERKIVPVMYWEWTDADGVQHKHKEEWPVSEGFQQGFSLGLLLAGVESVDSYLDVIDMGVRL